MKQNQKAIIDGISDEIRSQLLSQWSEMEHPSLDPDSMDDLIASCGAKAARLREIRNTLETIFVHQS